MQNCKWSYYKYLERNINDSQNGLREIVEHPWKKKKIKLCNIFFENKKLPIINLLMNLMISKYVK
jgi:hypothetical protein